MKTLISLVVALMITLPAIAARTDCRDNCEYQMRACKWDCSEADTDEQYTRCVAKCVRRWQRCRDRC